MASSLRLVLGVARRFECSEVARIAGSFRAYCSLQCRYTSGETARENFSGRNRRTRATAPTHPDESTAHRSVSVFVKERERLHGGG